jgi:GNAT superfamily N-acetyltransferase
MVCVLRIRSLRISELDRVREIERDASRCFREFGMRQIAEHEPPSVAELREFAEAGRGWVAVDQSDVLVAYLLTTVLDECAHVDQVSVAQSVRGRGVGAALIDHLAGIAAREGRAWLTLTTFLDVPWNAPYYRRLGFEPLGPDALGPGLAELVKVERVLIPGNHPRVAMRRGV